MSHRMPVIYLPHGGGPMPLLNDPDHRELTAFMRDIGARVSKPQAILVISAHWEEPVTTILSSPAPGMLYDYYGFPPESYEFKYPAPGNPALAARIQELLNQHGIASALDDQRDYDHGVFVPLLLMYPAADIPVIQISLLGSLNPAAEIAVGRAIAPLRDEGVLIIGSGLSFHNMRAFFSADISKHAKSDEFDQWLTQTLIGSDLDTSAQQARLEKWLSAPQGRYSHPREEHLLPLHVCFGAASAADSHAEKVFSGQLFGVQVSGFMWS